MQKNGLNIKAGAKAKIYFYGEIGKDIMSVDFVKALNEIEQKYSEVHIYINSVGGCVIEGLAMFTALRETDLRVNMYIEGIAASMASAFLTAADKVYMAEYARIMIHRPSGGTYGDSESLRSTADLIDGLETDLISLYASRTGKSNDWIKDNWMQPNKDVWFTAKEALKAGLVHEIYSNTVKEPPKGSNIQSIYSHYKILIKNTDMPFKNLIPVLKLQANASEQDVMNAITSKMQKLGELESQNTELTNKVTELSAKLTAKEGEHVKQHIENEAKRIGLTEPQKATYMALAKADFEATKTALVAMPTYQKISDQIGGGDGNVDKYKDYTFKDYQEKAPKALKDMKTSNPEKFKALFKYEFGVEPKI